MAGSQQTSKGRAVPWPVTRAQYNRACELVAQLEDVPAGSDFYMAIVDDLKSIPGYPRNHRMYLDTLTFVITDSTPITIARH